jgi:phosphoribosylaminoimidazolecarboxamide formyltransferase/IMP cyclohydrolase
VGSLDRAGGPIIGRALLAADRKEPIVPLARGLHARGVELYATDGTRRHLEGLGIPCRGTEEITGITGWFGGRVKTLHPKLFGGILAPRDEAGRRELETLALVPFDLVAVLFYPFEEALLAGVEPEEALPDDTEGLLSEMERTGGRVAPATRARLAAKAFRRTALYDAAVHAWLARVADPDTPRLVDLLAFARPGETLRYGENPHQRADLLVRASPPGVPLTPWPLVHLKGDALSYNNYLDLERALSLVSEFDGPAAVVVKHATPCGAASAEELPTALEQALETDPVARYGSVVAVNRPLTLQGVDALKGTFVDLLVGPSFPAEVQERLARRPKLKLVQGEAPARTDPRWEARTAAGRLLLQEVDRRELTPSDLHRVTRQAASAEELRSFPFAWKVVRHARSNAVALVRGTATVGIGSGQTSRVGAVRDALQVAGDRARGAVLASDAYFPFADGLEEAGRAGVRVVLQPGGSIRDAEVVAAADRLGLAMYFCGWRVFRH